VIALLQQYLTEQAERRPQSLALVTRDERVMYIELEEASNRLARLLRDVGCRSGDRICLVVPKAPYSILGMLGVLKAGGIYVPIDIATPAPRVERILTASAPRLLLAAEPARPLLEELRAVGGLNLASAVGFLDSAGPESESLEPRFSAEDWAGYSAEPLPSFRTTDDIAHILFTSGSTGIPKGVPILHRNVIRFVEWAVRYFGIGPSDRNSGHPPLHFDLSTFDIHGTLAAGAELHLVPPALSLLPHKLAAFIRDSELTQWFSVPSVLTYMAKFDALAGQDFPSLRRLLWCGEVLPTPTLIYWMERLPHVQFTNLYGPTEATIASSYYTIPRRPDSDTESIPIGAACEGEELYVLDDALRPVPPREIGEIYIGGAGLSPGYWRDEEKTRAAFVPNPLVDDRSARIYRTGDLGSLGDGGLLYFHGRADSQIKSRGYRIELGEIEAALSVIEGIRESAVVGVESDGFEGIAICCAYAPAEGSEVNPRKLRRELASVLPGYMLPQRWMRVAGLPKNANGKIDRRELKNRFVAQAQAKSAHAGSEAQPGARAS
jgi:amino acid adenylation domain-containing protein